MTRLKLLAISFLMLIGLGAHAQTMAVESFELAQLDLTANIQGTMVYDQNGEVCALIKMESTLDGFTFDVGWLGVTAVKRVGGEIWIYVPFGVKRISISHPQLGIIRDYPFPCPLDKGRTYIMKLTAGNVRTIVEHAVTRQFLCVELSPSDAILEVNGTMKVTENGAWQELLPFGKYSYRASRQDYHDAVGEVTVSNPTDPHIISIRLKPAFGHVSVLGDSESNGAVAYIDNRQVGKVPVNDIQLSSGAHTLRIMKELYKVYDETFVIADEERKQIHPHLVPDFAEVTLKTSEGASIYVNGTLKARHTWTGVLSSGSYIFETRQDGHIPFKTNFDITRADHTRTIQIDPPTPIYGTLILSSNPMRAKLYMNGKYIGDAPKQLPNCIIGNYKIEARMDGYKSQTKTVTVSEGQEASLAFTLEKITSPTTTANYSSYGSYASPQKAAVKSDTDKLNASKYKNKGLVHSLELSYGYQFGKGDVVYANYGYREYGSFHPVSLTYACGYRFNNYVSVALGTGLMYNLVNLRLYHGDYFATYNEEGFTAFNIPLFCNVKTYLTKSKCQPMLSFSGGDFLPHCELLVDAGLGCCFKVGRKGNIYLLTTISTTPRGEFVETDECFYYKKGFQWTPSIKLGFCFFK
jgi:hypothetical protein